MKSTFSSRKVRYMSISYSQLMIRCPCAGRVIKTPEGNKVCWAVLLCATLDLPAKAAVNNTKEWNGEYGCSVCLHKGDNSRQIKNSTLWPYNPSSLLRWEHMKVWLMMPKKFVIDCMHTVFLHVVHLRLFCGFGNKTRNEDYSIWQNVLLVYTNIYMHYQQFSYVDLQV